MSDVRERLREVIREWYAEAVDGEAVLTGWYLVAKGTGFGDEGDDRAALAQEWEADIIDQLGLVEYAAHRVRQRMDEEDRRD